MRREYVGIIIIKMIINAMTQIPEKTGNATHDQIEFEN